MNYMEFVKLMECKVSEKLGAEVSVQIYESKKNNGTVRTGIAIQSEHTNLSPTIYLEEFYRQFLEGTDISDLILSIERLYYQVELKQSMPFEEIFDFQKIKNKIVYKLINQAANAELLKEVPYKSFYDLAVVPYVLVDSMEMGAASMQIRKEHLSMWEVSEEEILTFAKDNGPYALPAEIGKLTEYMYVITNVRRYWGASAILYPGMLENAFKVIGESFFILPSSVHEFILVPESFGINAEGLKLIVKDINEEEVSPEEILSNNIYYYNSVNREVYIR